jgi:transcription elongation factor B polypeptide 3
LLLTNDNFPCFRTGYFGEVPSLFQMCIRVLQENVDDIYECGGLGFDIMKPVLERAQPPALMQIEEANHYLMEETGELWEKFVKKNFPKEEREEMESW